MFGVAVALTALLAPAALSQAGLPVDGPAAPRAVAFDEVNVLEGAFAPDGGAVAGSPSLRASVRGAAVNGYARGIFHVGWRAGDDVWQRSWFRLPRGFKAAMQGQVALLRRDDFRSHPDDTEYGGVVLYGADGHARLVREEETTDEQEELVGAFAVPEGRWFLLEVHQRFGGSSEALNEVFLDGRLVGSSRAANLGDDRVVERLRVGLVAIAAGAQTAPLSLRVAGAAIADDGPLVPQGPYDRRGAGPLPGPGGARVTTPVPDGVGVAPPAR